MFRKVVSLVLVFCVVLTMSPFVHAEEIASIPGDAFRVSDEFATVQFETTEGASDFDVIVVKHGGTAGKVEVDFKIIEVTAKYGEDFVILVPNRYSDTALKKETDSPTLLESALEENKDGFSLHKNEEPLEYTEVAPEYRSSLHQLRDEAVGEITKLRIPLKRKGISKIEISIRLLYRYLWKM